jgi:hypothetical protein
MEHERDAARELTSIMVEPEPGAGSLVLHADVGDVGCQVEVEGIAGRQHAIVRTLRSGPGTRYVAVFPSLAAGRYEVVSHDGRPEGPPVAIRDGQVTESAVR